MGMGRGKQGWPGERGPFLVKGSIQVPCREALAIHSFSYRLLLTRFISSLCPVAALHWILLPALQEDMEEPSPNSTNAHPQGQLSDPMLVESQLQHQLPSLEGHGCCLRDQRPHAMPLDGELLQQLPSLEHTTPSSHGDQSRRSSNQRTDLKLHASQLMQPLQTHMLPFLSLQSVAALRASCRTLQQLVDNATEAWLESASLWLPHKCLKHAVDSSTVQDMLRTQHRTMLGLRKPSPLSSDHLSSNPKIAVNDTTIAHVIQHDDWHRALKVQWAPAWPCPYIAILLERDEHFVPPDIEDEDELPDDAHAAILLETDTWLPLEGLDSQRPYAALQHGVWWPAPSGNAADTHTFVFICSVGFLLQVAEVAPKSKIQMISELSEEWIPIVLTPDGKAVQCYIKRGTEQVTSIVDLESLQERFCLTPAALTPTTGHSQADMMRLSPYWMDWSPSAGNVLAVAWHASDRPFYLSFHDASSGAVLKQIDLQAQISEESTDRPGMYSWSPSGKHVVMALNTRSSDVVGFEGGILEFDYVDDSDGWNHLMGPGFHTANVKVQWSPCGRYLHLEEIGEVGEEAVTYSYIWDTLRQDTILKWTDKTAGSLVLWSHPLDIGSTSMRSVCFVVTCHLLLVLPVSESIKRPTRILYDMPRNSDMASWAISPCGTLLVGTWQADAWSAQITCYDGEAASSSGLQLPHHLWHAEIEVHVHACCNQEAASSLKAWCMDSIAWHPSPISGRMYAIAREDGAVYLMDGRGHKCLCVWSAEQLHMPPGEPNVQLTWSPDGSQLAVAVWGRTTFLSFGS